MICLVIFSFYLYHFELLHDMYAYSQAIYNFSFYILFNADSHRIHVLTRSRSKAELIFPGKKVMNIWSQLIVS